MKAACGQAACLRGSSRGAVVWCEPPRLPAPDRRAAPPPIPVPTAGQYLFNITKEDANLSNFNGIFFLKFEDDTTAPNNTKLGVAANLIDYADCLLSKTLKITTKGCGEVSDDCQGCKGNASFVATLIESLNAAIMFGYLDEAVRIIETLDKTCDTCQGCPSQSELYLNGYGYGIIDDNITLW